MNVQESLACDAIGSGSLAPGPPCLPALPALPALWMTSAPAGRESAGLLAGRGTAPAARCEPGYRLRAAHPQGAPTLQPALSFPTRFLNDITCCPVLRFINPQIPLIHLTGQFVCFTLPRGDGRALPVAGYSPLRGVYRLRQTALPRSREG